MKDQQRDGLGEGARLCLWKEEEEEEQVWKKGCLLLAQQELAF